MAHKDADRMFQGASMYSSIYLWAGMNAYIKRATDVTMCFEAIIS